MRKLSPGCDFDPRRFRSNIMIEPTSGADGFVENAWIGRTLRIGDHLSLEVTQPCIRCVMVTLAQDDLPKDPRILTAAFQHNEGNLGVKAEVFHQGRLEMGDSVWVE